MATAPSSCSQRPPDPRSRSCDTACSSNSSCFFRRRKPVNPLAGPLRTPATRSSVSGVRQRVLSAKLLKLKSVQNQLNDANFHLAELMRENQALKTLEKRQDRALTKYEGANAELPRLLHSHEEEIRVLTEKNKGLRKIVKELNDQLKYRNDELATMQTQIKHLEKLDKDKSLLEREKLAEQVEDHRARLRKAENEIVVLNRKLMLETKCSRQKINLEVAKHRQSQKELAQALEEVERLTKLLESKDKLMSSGRKRFSNIPQKQSLSMVSLVQSKSLISELEEKSPVTEVKLEPIQCKKEETQNKELNGILKSPSDSVKARLSANFIQLEADQDKLSDSCSEKLKSRPGSSAKLEKLSRDLNNTISKVDDSSGEGLDRRLGDYCQQAIDTVKSCSDVIDSHRENLEYAKSDTDKLLESVKEVEMMEFKLKHSHMMAMENKNLDPDNIDFLSQILNEELSFRRKYGKDKNGNLDQKEPAVGLSDRRKLLATLRAIDNGDSVDSFDNSPERKNALIQEIFGDTND